MFILLKPRKGAVFVVLEFHLFELLNELDIIREVRNVLVEANFHFANKFQDLQVF